MDIPGIRADPDTDDSLGIKSPYSLNIQQDLQETGVIYLNFNLVA